MNNNNIIIIDNKPFLNCTPHPIVFSDGDVIEPDKRMARVLEVPSKIIKKTTREGISFVKKEFIPTEEEQEAIKRLLNEHPHKEAYIISAQAYGYPLVSPMSNSETKKKQAEKRVCLKNKWLCFWK